jgi:signal peptidase II
VTATVPRYRRRQLLIPVVAAVVVLADQLSKDWALHHLASGRRHVLGPTYFNLTFNSGAAFSLGRGVAPIVEAAVIVLVVWLIMASSRYSRSASVTAVMGLGLLLGGALGNLGDRVFRHIPGFPGAVVDFIQAVGWWPVFNVADASIVVGVVILAVSLQSTRRG